jgi:translation initiation factor 3 subunit A
MHVGKGVLNYVSQEVKDLYNLVEHEFHPLDLAAMVQHIMSKLLKLSDKLSSASSVPEVQLEQYVPALEKLTTLRVLQKVVVHHVTIYHDIITLFRSSVLFHAMLTGASVVCMDLMYSCYFVSSCFS